MDVCEEEKLGQRRQYKACSKVGRCAGMCTGMQVSAVSMSVKSQGKSLTRGRESIEINRRIGSLGA